MQGFLTSVSLLKERLDIDTAASSAEQSQQRHRITNILPVKGKEPYVNLVASVNFQNKE